MFRRAVLAAFALTLPSASLACFSSTSDSSVSQDELRNLAPEEIVGTIAFGETKGPIAHSGAPRYRALGFTAQAGDTIDVWVRSTDGDPMAFLLRSDFKSIATNDDADATTKDAHIVQRVDTAGQYFIAFREHDFEPSTFNVTLAPKPDMGMTGMTPTGPNAGACPMLGASYSGKLTGTVMGAVMGPVTGTLSLKLKPGATPDAPIVDMTSKIDSTVAGLPVSVNAPAGQTVKCGALNLSQMIEPVPGIKVNVSATCTFTTAAGCTNGVFNFASADGTTVKASGTFSLSADKTSVAGGGKQGAVSITSLPSPDGNVTVYAGASFADNTPAPSSCATTSEGACTISQCAASSGGVMTTTAWKSAGAISLSALGMSVASLNAMNGLYAGASKSVPRAGLSIPVPIHVTAMGGDVPAFMADVTLPAPVQISAPQAMPGTPLSLDRTTPIDVAWTGGNGGTTSIFLTSAEPNATSIVLAQCPATAGATTFEIPTAVLGHFSAAHSLFLSLYSTTTANVTAGDWNIAVQASSSGDPISISLP